MRKDVAQIDESKSNVMSRQNVRHFAVKACE